MAGKGKIPTAEEEALQEPSIDPAFLAATGLSEGPLSALKLLAGLLGQDAVLNAASSKLKSLLQYLGTPRAANAISQGVERTYEAGNPPTKGMGRFFKPSSRNYAASRLVDRNYAKVPESTSMYGPEVENNLRMKIAKLLAESPNEFGNMKYLARRDRLEELMKSAKKIPISILSEAE